MVAIISDFTYFSKMADIFLDYIYLGKMDA